MENSKKIILYFKTYKEFDYLNEAFRNVLESNGFSPIVEENNTLKNITLKNMVIQTIITSNNYEGNEFLESLCNGWTPKGKDEIKYKLVRIYSFSDYKPDDIKKFTNGVFGYLKKLYSINKNILKIKQLLKKDNMDVYVEIENLFLDIISEIFVIIPIGTMKKNETNYLKVNNEGLVKFENIVPIKAKFKDLLYKYYDQLAKYRIIRNKSQHAIHENKITESGNFNNNNFDIMIIVDDIFLVEVYFKAIQSLIKDINIIFDDIVLKLREIKAERELDGQKSLYLDRVTKLMFSDFNRFYEQNELSFSEIILNDF